jgi:hypothetical protein
LGKRFIDEASKSLVTLIRELSSARGRGLADSGFYLENARKRPTTLFSEKGLNNNRLVYLSAGT